MPPPRYVWVQVSNGVGVGVANPPDPWSKLFGDWHRYQLSPKPAGRKRGQRG